MTKGIVYILQLCFNIFPLSLIKDDMVSHLYRKEWKRKTRYINNPIPLIKATTSYLCNLATTVIPPKVAIDPNMAKYVRIFGRILDMKKNKNVSLIPNPAIVRTTQRVGRY